MKPPSSTDWINNVRYFNRTVPKPAKNPTRTLNTKINWRSEIYLYLHIKILVKMVRFLLGIFNDH